MFLTGKSRDAHIAADAAESLGEDVRVVGRFNIDSSIPAARLVSSLLGRRGDREIVCTDTTIAVFECPSWTARLGSLEATYSIAATDVTFQDWVLTIGAVKYHEGAAGDAQPIVDHCQRQRLALTGPDWNHMESCPSCGREYPKGQHACGWCGQRLR